jgi:murein DD-endopeptidase MepM/ murein hydrolase activator NlpD
VFSLTNNPLHPLDSENRKNRSHKLIGGFSFRGRGYTLVVGAVVLAVLVFAATLLLKKKQPDIWASAKTQLSVDSPASLLPKFREIVGSFQKNQTVTGVLLQQGLSTETINQIIDSARPVYNLAKVKASQLYWLCFTQDGRFRAFRYPVDDERYLTIYHDEAQDCYVPVMKNFQYETRVETVSGVIENSLFASMADIGENEQLALDLADIFGSDIDFNTDIQKGDSFEALLEKKYLDGKFTRNGPVLTATVVNQQKSLTGIRFTDENGKPAYYAPDGQALKRSFLKAPLKIIRITSRFSRARFHPVLRIVRPHLGVDYAAPAGTPVQSVSAGKVVSAGQSGGSGKMVNIRHAGGYETRYLHLSRIAVRSGTRVDRGQVIGYVGSTGLSTGPHLDFRISQNGKAINPTKVIFPPGKPVSPAQFGQFAELRNKLMDVMQAKDSGSKLASTATGSIR